MDYAGARDFAVDCLTRQLPPEYAYHDVRHSIDVADFAGSIGRQAGVGEADILLLMTAAIFHDAGYMYRYEQNEALAADFAARELPRFGYGAAQIALVRELIHATEFPQHPATLLQQIICDADLFYLITDDAPERIKAYRRELAHVGKVYSEPEWQSLQNNFLRKQHFSLPFCEAAYQQRLPGLLKEIEPETNKADTK